jgi:hypothetical protein
MKYAAILNVPPEAHAAWLHGTRKSPEPGPGFSVERSLA